jgi:gas vesicle protein
MAEDRGGSGGSVLVAFVLGAVAGAAVALLWAPAPGEETRRKLGDRAREGRDKATEAARQGREFIKAQRDNLTSAFERGKDAFDQARGPKEPA